jgi:aminoglycoside phosphotransferase (APT) family kinase protein
MADNQFTPQDILRFLGITDTTTITPVLGGSDTTIWRVESAGKICALRLYHPGQVKIWQREQTIMRAAQTGGLPVPHILAADIWQERPVLLISWITGKTMGEIISRQPWRTWQMGVLFGRMQATIHTVSVPDLLNQSPDEWIRWSGAGEDALQAYLSKMPHSSETLLHLDYHPFNVLTDGKKVTGVIDWANADIGEPRADAARTVTILRIDSIGKLPPHEKLVRRVFEWGWRFGYRQQGHTPGNLSPFYAWAGAVMEKDLATKRNADDLQRIHQWTWQWKQRLRL